MYIVADVDQVVRTFNHVLETCGITTQGYASITRFGTVSVGDVDVSEVQKWDLTRTTRDLEDERSYVQALERLYTLKLVLEQQIGHSDDLYNTFGNIDKIFDLHLEFLLRIETAKTEQIDLSSALYILSERFHECYLPYISNHKRSLETAAQFYQDQRLGSNKIIPPDLQSTTESLSNFSMSLARPVVKFYNYIQYLKVGA